MKILLVIDDYSTSNNGTSISCQRFAEELRRQGEEVRILSKASVDPDCVVDYPLKELHVYPFDHLIHSYGFAFAKPDRDTMYEAIGWCDIVHFYMPFGVSYYGKKIADELGKPATIAFHIQPENIWGGVKMNKVKPVIEFTYAMWRKTLYNKFEYIHTPSAFMRDVLIQHGYSGDIRDISNGIADDFVYTKTPLRPEWEGRIVITMVGRLAHEKRQDLVIRAAKYSKYSNKIQLVFAGRGPLQRQYEELGRHLTFPPIFVYENKQELIDLLGQSTIYIHASDMESEAISCIEAFATGLVPIISDSRLSATRQFALDERSLFHAGDAHDLANKIDYWLDNPKERIKMEKRYAKSAQKYTLEQSVRQFVEMFEDEITKHEEEVEEEKAEEIKNSETAINQ